MTTTLDGALDVLIVAAFPPELAPFRRVWGAGATAIKTSPDDDEDAGLRARGQVGALAIGGGTVGIGLATAAVGACALVLECRPKAVILVGTAGAYPAAGLDVGDAIVSTSSVLVDRATCTGEGALVASMADPRPCDAALAAAMTAHGAKPAAVGTTLSLTTSDVAAKELEARFGCAAEHLETHAVATACARFAVPFVSVLGIANAVGSKGRSQWRAHQDEAAEASADVVRDAITSGTLEKLLGA